MKYIIVLICGLCGGITLINLARCLACGKVRAHQKLMRVALVLALVLLVRFGGGGLLALFGMGWRSQPRNILNAIWVVLLLAAVWNGVEAYWELPREKRRHKTWSALCFFVTFFSIIFSAVFYSMRYQWHDWTAVQNGRLVVVESDETGSIGRRFAYLYVSPIVHGREVEYLWMS